jgi:hypothetical protein
LVAAHYTFIYFRIGPKLYGAAAERTAAQAKIALAAQTTAQNAVALSLQPPAVPSASIHPVIYQVRLLAWSAEAARRRQRRCRALDRSHRDDLVSGRGT